MTTVRSHRVLLAICYLGFVSLGLPDTLIGIAWPSVRDTFHLRQSQISWIFVGSGASYFVSSFFAGRLLKLYNVGILLAGSSGLVALSAFNYGFATIWPWFALGAILHGLGSGAIDAGLNHYVATHFSARHMNWLHASYSLGAMLGPVIMTACVAHANHWRLGYLIVAVTLALLAGLFLATRSRWAEPASVPVPASSGEGVGTDSGRSLDESANEPPNLSHLPQGPRAKNSAHAPTAWDALGNCVVRMHVLLFFIYTGLEVAVGQWSFTVLTESRGVDPETAGSWVTLYWAGILAGRITFGFFVHRISIDRLIRLSLILALCGAALFAADVAPLAAPVALTLCGLGLAVIFPCLMTRTPERLGQDLAAHAIGFQVGAAMLGAAVVPSICGLVAQHRGLHLVAVTLAAVAALLFVLHELLLLTVCPGAPRLTEKHH